MEKGFVGFILLAGIVMSVGSQHADAPGSQHANAPGSQHANEPGSQHVNVQDSQHAAVPDRLGWAGEAMCRPTSADVIGPYYFPNPPPRLQLCVRDPQFANLPALLVVGKIRGEDCTPLQGAKIEIWQADHSGHYIMSEHCRGFIHSRRGGYYSFLTIHPGKYTVDGEYRPAHIHFRVELEGYNILVTQMYFAGDSSLGRNDSCTACQSGMPDLIVESYTMCPDDTGTFCFNMAHFDITLRRGHAADVVPDVDDEEAELLDLVQEGK